MLHALLSACFFRLCCGPASEEPEEERLQQRQEYSRYGQYEEEDETARRAGADAPVLLNGLTFHYPRRSNQGWGDPVRARAARQRYAVWAHFERRARPFGCAWMLVSVLLLGGYVTLLVLDGEAVIESEGPWTLVAILLLVDLALSPCLLGILLVRDFCWFATCGPRARLLRRGLEQLDEIDQELEEARLTAYQRLALAAATHPQLGAGLPTHFHGLVGLPDDVLGAVAAQLARGPSARSLESDAATLQRKLLFSRSAAERSGLVGDRSTQELYWRFEAEGFRWDRGRAGMPLFDYRSAHSKRVQAERELSDALGAPTESGRGCCCTMCQQEARRAPVAMDGVAASSA